MIYTKVLDADVSVMEQHYCAFGKLRQPSLKIVLYVFIKMTPVNMQQVNRAIPKICPRLVKGRADEPGEITVLAIVVIPHRGKKFFTVEAAVLVTLPGVHRKCVALRVEALQGLIKDEVRKPVMGANLTKGRGLRNMNQQKTNRRIPGQAETAKRFGTQNEA